MAWLIQATGGLSKSQLKKAKKKAAATRKEAATQDGAPASCPQPAGPCWHFLPAFHGPGWPCNAYNLARDPTHDPQLLSEPGTAPATICAGPAETCSETGRRCPNTTAQGRQTQSRHRQQSMSLLEAQPPQRRKVNASPCIAAAATSGVQSATLLKACYQDNYVDAAGRAISAAAGAPALRGAGLLHRQEEKADGAAQHPAVAPFPRRHLPRGGVPVLQGRVRPHSAVFRHALQCIMRFQEGLRSSLFARAACSVCRPNCHDFDTCSSWSLSKGPQQLALRPYRTNCCFNQAESTCVAKRGTAWAVQPEVAGDQRGEAGAGAVGAGYGQRSAAVR